MVSNTRGCSEWAERRSEEYQVVFCDGVLSGVVDLKGNLQWQWLRAKNGLGHVIQSLGPGCFQEGIDFSVQLPYFVVECPGMYSGT